MVPRIGKSPQPRAAVLGSPISHSLSPLLHRAAYRKLGLDWQYDAIEVTVPGLASFVEDFRRDDAWMGLSVTMPLKQHAMDLSDRRAAVCVATRAANTITKDGDELVCDNTDPIGIRFALERVGITTLADQSVCLIGAGATGRSAMYALWELGVGEVDVIARRPEAIAELAELGRSIGVGVSGHAWTHRPPLRYDLTISVVPAGVADELAPEVPDSPGALLDVVYVPWPSALTGAWAAAGGVVADGLDMLVGQAARQVALMTGMPAPIDAMLAAAESTRR